MAYGRNYYSDQQVFLAQQGSSVNEIKGVQSFDGSWSIPRNDILAAGYEYVGQSIEGELLGEISVSRSIIQSSDPITAVHSVKAELLLSVAFLSLDRAPGDSATD